MKKTASVLIMIATLFFATNVMAQVQLGLQGGVNLGDVSLDPTPTGTTTTLRTGVMFGGVLFYGFSPILGVQIEPAYVQVGSKEEYSETDGGHTYKMEGTVKGDYLEIPVLLKATFGEGPVKPFITAGAAVGFLLGDITSEGDKYTVDGVDVTSLVPSDQRTDTLKTKSTDFMLRFGGGVVIPLGQANIFIEGLYSLGLTDINDDPDNTVNGTVMTVKTTGIQIKAGVMFPL
jgi:hypothetical protein